MSRPTSKDSFFDTDLPSADTPFSVQSHPGAASRSAAPSDASRGTREEEEEDEQEEEEPGYGRPRVDPGPPGALRLPSAGTPFSDVSGQSDTDSEVSRARGPPRQALHHRALDTPEKSEEDEEGEEDYSDDAESYHTTPRGTAKSLSGAREQPEGALSSRSGAQDSHSYASSVRPGSRAEDTLYTTSHKQTSVSQEPSATSKGLPSSSQKAAPSWPTAASSGVGGSGYSKTYGRTSGVKETPAKVKASQSYLDSAQSRGSVQKHLARFESQSQSTASHSLPPLDKSSRGTVQSKAVGQPSSQPSEDEKTLTPMSESSDNKTAVRLPPLANSLAEPERAPIKRAGGGSVGMKNRHSWAPAAAARTVKPLGRGSSLTRSDNSLYGRRQDSGGHGSEESAHRPDTLPPITSPRGSSQGPTSTSIYGVPRVGARKKTLPTWRLPPKVKYLKRTHPWLGNRKQHTPPRPNIIKARSQGPSFNFTT